MADCLPSITAAVNTAELLEDILVRIDMKTLLLSQRVSKSFKQTIEGSPLLQEALFFKTPKLPPTSTNINELLLNSRIGGQLDGTPVRIDTCASTFRFTHQSLAWHKHYSPRALDFCMYAYVAAVAMDLSQRTHGSWERMFLTHGAPGSEISCIVADGIDVEPYFLVFRESMKLGEVVDMVVAGVDERLDWPGGARREVQVMQFQHFDELAARTALAAAESGREL